MLKPKCPFGVVTFAGAWATAAGEARISATRAVKARRFTSEALRDTGPRKDDGRAMTGRPPSPIHHARQVLRGSILMATTPGRKAPRSAARSTPRKSQGSSGRGTEGDVQGERAVTFGGAGNARRAPGEGRAGAI